MSILANSAKCTLPQRRSQAPDAILRNPMGDEAPDQDVAQERIIERTVLDDDRGARDFLQKLRPHRQRGIGYFVDPVEDAETRTDPLRVIGSSDGRRSTTGPIVIRDGRSKIRSANR